MAWNLTSLVSTLILFFGMAADPDAFEALDGPAAVGAIEVAFELELELEVEALALACTDYKNQEFYGLRPWKLDLQLHYFWTSAMDSFCYGTLCWSRSGSCTTFAPYIPCVSHTCELTFFAALSLAAADSRDEGGREVSCCVSRLTH